MCTEGLRAIPECCGSRTQFASDQAHDRQVATQRSESGYEEEREGGYRRAANVFLQHSSRNDRKQRKRAPTRSRYNRLPVGQAARPLLVTCARLKEQNHPGGSSTMPKPRWASDRTVDQDPIEKRAKSTFPCRRRLLRCASGHCKHTTRSSACHPRHGCFYPGENGRSVGSSSSGRGEATRGCHRLATNLIFLGPGQPPQAVDSSMVASSVSLVTSTGVVICPNPRHLLRDGCHGHNDLVGSLHRPDVMAKHHCYVFIAAVLGLPFGLGTVDMTEREDRSMTAMLSSWHYHNTPASSSTGSGRKARPELGKAWRFYSGRRAC
nr:hypothetical protein CFP56_23900 [Quercus suber]